jgi:hypothetical protein
MHAIAISRQPQPLAPPLLTCALVGIAVLGCLPGAALGWEPGAAPWRLLTSQLAHWDGDHLLWDALAVLIFGCWAEGRWPGRTRLGIIIALPLIPLAVVLVHPDMAFRGLSGLACTLVTVAAIGTWRDGRRDGDALAAGAAMALIAILLGKTGYETLTGDTVFAAAEGWWPVPLAHAVGTLAGWLACAAPVPNGDGTWPGKQSS